MALFVWNESMSVGVKEFDQQHQKLIGMINDLHDAMAQGKGSQVLGPILSQLVDYTKLHFANEEKVFQKFGYPDMENHKRQHDSLTQQVVDLQAKYAKGQVGLTIEVMHFLRDWLTKHILETDKRYSSFMNQKGLK